MSITANDLFEGDKPAVAPTYKIHKASDEVGCAACQA
jgi:hypothetical protein